MVVISITIIIAAVHDELKRADCFSSLLAAPLQPDRQPITARHVHSAHSCSVWALPPHEHSSKSMRWNSEAASGCAVGTMAPRQWVAQSAEAPVLAGTAHTC
jgi:hypothetical protein